MKKPIQSLYICVTYVRRPILTKNTEYGRPILDLRDY